MPTVIRPIPIQAIEPAVNEPQLGRPGRDLEKAERGAEGGEAVVSVRHAAP